MKGQIAGAVVGLAAFVAAGCGSGSGSSNTGGKGVSTGLRGNCTASIGIEAPISGNAALLGSEQLAFAKLAVQNDNAANGTKITLVEGDTQLTPSLATMVAEQMISNGKIVGVVGPASDAEVGAVGPLFGRAGVPFVSGSATETTLTDGSNPTFFRVVAKDSVQGPEDANYIVRNLHPKAVMIVDDHQAYSTRLVSSMIPVFRAAGITVDHESVPQGQTYFSSLAAKVTPQMSVVVLPWQVAANGEEFGKNLAEQHKKATIFGTDRLQSSSFTIPGSYVSAFGPDLTVSTRNASIAAQAKQAYPRFGRFGPPVYAATHVVDQAIASVCRAGETPSRNNVLPAVKRTDEPTSILGQPIKFDSHGDLVGGKWFLFHIDGSGKYELVKNSSS